MFRCDHNWELQELTMSVREPPKAWYEFRCFDCGEMAQGHSEDIAHKIPSVKKETPEDEEIIGVEDIEEAYVRGEISHERMEEEMNRLFGLD